MPHHYWKAQKSSDMSWTDTRHNINNNTADWGILKDTIRHSRMILTWFSISLAARHRSPLSVFSNVLSNLLNPKPSPGDSRKHWCLISSKYLAVWIFHQDNKFDDLFTWAQTPWQALSTKNNFYARESQCFWQFWNEQCVLNVIQQLRIITKTMRYVANIRSKTHAWNVGRPEELEVAGCSFNHIIERLHV